MLARAQVAPTDALSIATDVAVIVIAVAVIVLLVLWASLVAKVHRVLSELRGSARQSFGPVSDRARSISDNVEFITQAVRGDVEKLNASVSTLTDRLNLASNRMEERIEEFNALMEVVQGEAEDIFIETASTVRGVREGARAIANPARRDYTEARDEHPDEDLQHPVPRRVAPVSDRHVSRSKTAIDDDAVHVGDA
jgi:uncharacterized protein YoxC